MPIEKTYAKTDFRSEKINYFSYRITGKSLMEDGDLTFYQAFDKGWKAYKLEDDKISIINGLEEFFPFIFGKEIKDHVLINNWANGWILNNKRVEQSDNRIVIVYLPQYLEYLGFGILVTFALYALKYRSLN